MRPSLAAIPELPSEEHPYFLVPARSLELPPAAGGTRPRRVVYRELGAGRPVLLLHGLWTTGFTFRALLSRLQAARCRAVVPELVPAEAEPLLPGGDATPAALAALVAEIIQALGLVTPTVVGHAELGLAGLCLALERPQAVGTLVTLGVCTQLPASARLRGFWLNRSGGAERWARRTHKDPTRAALEMLAYADPTVLSRQELRELARGWASLPAARTRARLLAQTLAPGYRRDVLARLQALAASGASFPAALKLVHGDRDPLAPPAQGRRLTQLLPGAELFVAERAGGAPQVESPEWTARVISGAAGAGPDSSVPAPPVPA
ncbi:MAG TPA: alpha/beta hydrolase [Myxococcota bacterium]|nr:alpha/beta hydrolase [Myxococcota bacterium]HRY93536.1 alpha/beta hydrolase [Myxococcota bacterium]HSA21242.1 alpha/beta hydrolase [Myxococcota bacterium]